MRTPRARRGQIAGEEPQRAALSQPHAQPEPQAKRHEVLGLLVLAVALLTGLALGSYDARGGRDWVGPLGATVAETLVALLGSASLAIPLAFLAQSVRFFLRTTRRLAPLRIVGTVGIVVTVAAALHLVCGERPMLGHLAAGGLVGVSIGETLRAFVGTAGANLIVLTVLLIALVVRTRLSVVAFARGAQQAGVRTGHMAREGVVTVAKAWQQSRPVDSEDEPLAHEPRLLLAEARAEAALADVIARHESALQTSDEEPNAESASEIAGDSSAAAISAAGVALNGLRPAHPAAYEAIAPVLAMDTVGEVLLEQARSTPTTPTTHVEVLPLTPSLEPPPMVSENTDESAATRRRPSRRAPRPVSLVEGADEGAVPAPAVARVSVLSVPAPPSPRVPVVVSVSEPAPVVLAPAESETAVAPPMVPVRAPVAPSRKAMAAEKPAETVTALNIVSHDDEIAQACAMPPEHDARAKVASASVAYEMPPTSFLTRAPTDGIVVDEGVLRAAAERLIKTLKDYQIEGEIVEIHPGPVVTTFEFVPTAGTKLARISARSDDIAMSLAVNKVRIVAPIPGKGRVGFEIPNDSRRTVYFRELIETEAFGRLGGALPVAMGKDVVGAPFFSDLATMPHLIVAGATGQGKSVGLNVMLCSLLYKRAPEQVRMLMIDPKMVELAVYDGIPHMLLPVVTDMKKAALALRWVVDEMERRYSLFAQTGSRNIVSYNERVERSNREGTPLKGAAGPVRTKVNGTTRDASKDAETEEETQAIEPKELPYIVVVVDEFADLMMVAGKEVEAAVARLAQKARAAGIHVILATQRPSVDVITGMIKANFPSRIAFKVTSKVDSRTILDQQGSENLLGKGDMLILPPGSGDLRRVHCAFVSEDEVQAITDHWRNQGTPTYDEDILRPREEEEGPSDEPEIKVPAEKYEKAVSLVLSSRRCSVSWIQRQLAIGYNVAARIVERMERDGIVSPPRGPGKDREILS
ncbi:MAG: DNA translocase FtsK 4TM domain-containing protein [Deltaproteobacteria bacterium]|nr:DNA translocase FtsK 4TM domain-containing protein [Deltaproteobacteria bacterium]